MLNKEKFAQEIIDCYIKYGNLPARVKGKFVECCSKVDCTDCEFNDPYGEERCGKFFIDWLKDEYRESILTDKEKEYLSAVIKPFRDDIFAIKKEGSEGFEDITIILCHFGAFSLPPFPQMTMYKGMELNREYTLRELQL